MTTLPDAQAAIVAMMEACGLRQVTLDKQQPAIVPEPRVRQNAMRQPESR